MPRRAEPEVVRPVERVEEVDEDRPPAECGRETWRKCLQLARSLEANFTRIEELYRQVLRTRGDGRG